MKSTRTLSLLMMILPHFSNAEVDLLTGAFEFRIPQSELHYNSRRTELSELGFGWCIQKDGSCQASARPGLGQGTIVKLNNQNLTELILNKQKWLFKYDDLHNLSEIKYPSGEVLKISYSETLDRVSSILPPDGCGETFDYREESFRLRLSAKRRCAGRGEETIKMTAEYFPSRRQVRSIQWRKSDRDGQRTAMSTGGLVYDDAGRLIQREDNGDRFTYVYDDLGVITEVLREYRRADGILAPLERTVFEYDPGLRLKRIVTPQKQEIDLNYDQSGRLQSLDEDTLAVALALRAALENLSPIEGGLAL